MNVTFVNIDWVIKFSLIKVVNEFSPVLSILSHRFGWKFGTKNFQVVPLSKCQFRGNRRIESRTLLQRVSNFFSLFYVFLSLWIQLGAGDVPEHLLRSDFRENRRTCSRALRRGVYICPHIAHLLSYLDEVQRKRSIQNYVQRLRVSWKSTQGRPYFCYGLKSNCIYAGTVGPYDILEVKNAFVTSTRLLAIASRHTPFAYSVWWTYHIRLWDTPIQWEAEAFPVMQRGQTVKMVIPLHLLLRFTIYCTIFDTYTHLIICLLTKISIAVRHSTSDMLTVPQLMKKFMQPQPGILPCLQKTANPTYAIVPCCFMKHRSSFFLPFILFCK
jgi:hypothetical protein